MKKFRHIDWDAKDGAAENAKRRLPKLAAAYFAEVRKVLARNPAPPELHRLRLASKHFRYTLELFRPCYAAGLEQRLNALRTVQDLLGDTNDAVASRELIDRVLRRNPQKRKVLNQLESLAAKRAAAFRKHWSEQFDAEGREEWWTGYLARNARPPAPAKRR